MKKNITFAILTLATLAALAGCKKETFSDKGKPQSGALISVGISDTRAKTTIGPAEEGKRPVYWANGDAIAANGQASHALEGVEPECRKVDFVFDEAVSYPCNFLYPASYYTGENTISIPEIQKFAPVVPMCAYSESETDAVTMAPVAAVLKIPVKLKSGDDPNKLKSIIVTATNNNLVGTFTIDYATGALTPGEGSKKMTVIVGKTLEDTAVEVYAVIPPSPEESYTVQIIDVTGACMTRTLSGKNYKAGTVYALSELEFDPSGEVVDIEITSAEELVTFATNFNAGQYDEPIVRIMNDIVFDEATSAAFVQTGGIGTEDGYFNGCVDGNGYTISQFVNFYPVSDTDTLFTPIFAYTGAGGIITDLNLAADCQFVFQKGNSSSFVGRHKGILKNCTNNADVALHMVAGVTNFGGLVGRIYGGSVENCTMNGRILNEINSDGASTKVYNVGGIAATVEDGGRIEGCAMNNVIVWGLGTGATGPKLNNGTLNMGLVAGCVIDGDVASCLTTTDVAGGNSDVRGSATGCIGGIVGELQKGSVTACTNGQYIYARLSSGQFLYMGGIVGANSGTVKSCTNNAKSTSNGGQLIVCSGGICGLNNAGAEIIGCGNSGTVVGPSQYTSTTAYYAGGIVGKNEGTLSGETPFANSGSVSANSAKLANTVAYMGGIAGSTSTSISNCTNSGNVELGRDTDATGKTVQSVSGAIGLIETDGVTIDNVTNTGNVTYSATAKLNGRPSRLGGIVGNISAGNVSVQNCTNEGKLANNNFNNTYALTNGAIAGGIVGVATGNSENKIVIRNCINQKETYQGQRGIIGGIVGYIDYGEVNECNNTQNTGAITANITAFTGGVAGWAIHTLLKSCNVSSTINQKNTIAANVGGVVAKLDESSIVDGCTYQGKITCQAPSTGSATAAGIANSSVATSTIKNCKFKGQYSLDGGAIYSYFVIGNVCCDTNFIDGGGNEIME